MLTMTLDDANRGDGDVRQLWSLALLQVPPWQFISVLGDCCCANGSVSGCFRSYNIGRHEYGCSHES